MLETGIFTGMQESNYLIYESKKKISVEYQHGRISKKFGINIFQYVTFSMLNF
jgi:hypothetical protein